MRAVFLTHRYIKDQIYIIRSDVGQPVPTRHGIGKLGRVTYVKGINQDSKIMWAMRQGTTATLKNKIGRFK